MYIGNGGLMESLDFVRWGHGNLCLIGYAVERLALGTLAS